MQVKSSALVAIGLVFAFGLAACKTTPPPPKITGTKMTGEELTALYLSGNPTIGQGKSVRTGTTYKIERDGKGTQTLQDENGYSDSGSYRIDSDKLCSKWVEIRKGKEGCFEMYRQEDGSIQAVNSEGKVITTGTIKSVS